MQRWVTCHLVEDPWKEGWQCKCQSLSYIWLCNPMDCSPLDSSVHGIFQARILEWVAIPFSRDLADPGIKPRSPSLQVDSLLSEPPGKHGEIVVLIKRLKLGLRRRRAGSLRVLRHWVSVQWLCNNYVQYTCTQGWMKYQGHMWNPSSDEDQELFTLLKVWRENKSSYVSVP